MKITLEDLRDLDACAQQVQLFDDIFPEGAYWTGEDLAKAVNAHLDVIWAFNHMDLPPSEDTRAVACADPELSVCYGRFIDRGPHDDTRAAACATPQSSLDYGRFVDRTFHKDTWTGAQKNAHTALFYRTYVSKTLV